MLVYLAGARFEFGNNIDRIRELTRVIKACGAELVDDWVEDATGKGMKKNGQYPDIDWSNVQAQSVELVGKADVVIADATFRSFRVGYEVAVAVQAKKPVLILHSAQAEKQGDISIGYGIEGKVLYDDQTFQRENLEEIIKKFLDDNDTKLKDMRFNFFIDRKIYSYLRWASYKTGKTKAEIIRELIEREIDGKDF